jgi:hypothetical protein
MNNPSIGKTSESSLHRTLKYRYAGYGKTEEEVAGFIADGITQNGEIIEVQIGSFGPLKKKMTAFAAMGAVNIIHPIIINKFIEVYDEKGKYLYRRKSPRHGCEWDLFYNLLYAPELVLIPGLSIELALVDVTEKRRRDGKGSWRRKGVSILDKELAAWHGCLRLNRPGDYLRFIPFGKGEEFTAAQLAKKAGIATGLSQKTIYVLKKLNLIRKTGKKGRAWIYQPSGMSSASRLFSAKRSVTARRSSK